MLRQFTNNLTRWDRLLFDRIFGWGNERILLDRLFRLISWSANGWFYPFLILYVYLTFSPAISKPFFLSMVIAFSLERLLYHLIKQSMKRIARVNALWMSNFESVHRINLVSLQDTPPQLF